MAGPYDLEVRLGRIAVDAARAIAEAFQAAGIRTYTTQANDLGAVPASRQQWFECAKKWDAGDATIGVDMGLALASGLIEKSHPMGRVVTFVAMPSQDRRGPRSSRDVSVRGYWNGIESAPVVVRARSRVENGVDVVHVDALCVCADGWIREPE